MGQKLEKPGERSESWEQTGEMNQTEAAKREENRNRDNSNLRPNISGPAAGHTGGLTLTPARTDSQIWRPIRRLGRRDHARNTTGERMGGDREIRRVARAAEESKSDPCPKETRQSPYNKRGSKSKAVTFTGTTAMEEPGNGKESELGQRKLAPDARTGSKTASYRTVNEEDFVVLEEDKALMSAEGENDIMFGNRIQADDLQSFMKRRVEEGPSASSSDNLPQPRTAPQGAGLEKRTRRKSNTPPVIIDSVEAHAKSLPAACCAGGTGQHLAEVTGSRCRLKGASYVGAELTETTGEAEREEYVNERGEGHVSTDGEKQHQSTRHNSVSMKRSRKNTEDMDDEAVQLGLQEESCLEKEDPLLRQSETQGKEDPARQSKFAGTVLKRAKVGTLNSPTRKEDSQAVRSPHPPKLPSFEIQQLQDNQKPVLDQSDLIPFPPLIGDEGCDGKKQIACLKRESELVCFSAVITPPRVIHWLPERETSAATPPGEQMELPALTDSKDASVATEKPKVKGPPPPVPKKPKNPFIKLKTAQLMSGDVQRRGKDHPRSEERVKRRHTFHFNKDSQEITPKTQDMCTLWDERGAYTAPANKRPLSISISPWEDGSFRRVGDQYGNMIDFDYCARMEQLSPDEDLQNLDMLERSVFLERRSRFKSTPPPVANKPPNRSVATERLHSPEVIPDNEGQRPKAAGSRRREISPEFQSEVSNHRSHDHRREAADHGGNRDAGNDCEVASYKPVAVIVKETNQMQRHQTRAKPEAAKTQVRVEEPSPSVNVSQMKNAFDVPKKSKEKPPEVRSSPKKGKDLLYLFVFPHKQNKQMVYQSMQTHTRSVLYY